MNYKIFFFCLFFFSICYCSFAQSARVSNQNKFENFEPTWSSLNKYDCPEWFRDAKFGIWSHWGPQSVPEMGDWYARFMYGPQASDSTNSWRIETAKIDYAYHVANYGHPSVFGYKDLIPLFKAEKWNPDSLMKLYYNAGARYFMSMGQHHDNYDMWDSKFQSWNSVNIGPHKDIVRQWHEAAKKYNIRFGVSFHGSSSWSWFEPSRSSDPDGPHKGVKYDGILTKEDGKGKWWEGYDPQDLYEQHNHKISPDVLDRRLAWKNPGDLPSKAYLQKYYNRVMDLMNHYHPELIYFDDSVLPLKENDQSIGLNIVANAYNASMARNKGINQTVVNTKNLDSEQKKCLVHDFEVGVARDIFPEPWQVDACIGGWHYKKDIVYKTADQVIRALIDVVSKNGNLLLNIPVRSNGTIDAGEAKILENIGKWLNMNGEAIYGTRPWIKYGEGPSTTEIVPDIPKGGLPLFRKASYTAEDIRFTTKGKQLYAIALNWPADNRLLIKSLAKSKQLAKGEIKKVKLIGCITNLKFKQTEFGLEVLLPSRKPCDIAYVICIEGLK